MKTSKDKEKFIGLRAGGMSFAKIAQEIGVSKPTLIKWNLEFGIEVENRRFLEVEELFDQYRIMHATRIKILGEILGKALEELQSRDFGLTSLKDLIALINHLEVKLMRESGGIQYTTDQQVSRWASIDEHEAIKIGLFNQN